MTLYRLEPGVQHYAWGETRFIPSLLGRDNVEGKPFAELWMGAHPDLPSRVDGKPLSELVSESPELLLGDRVAREFGNQLPYLLKVLSAAKPLSIQAHPGESQAREGFARENRDGIPLEAPHRNYKDPHHKPELIVALTDFYALRGFRPLAEIGAVLADVPELVRFASDFERTNASLKSLYEKLMTLPEAEVDAVLGPLVTRLRPRTFDRAQREYWLLRCANAFCSDGRYDRGLFSILLLNFVHLKPGDGLYLDAGTLHAYLEGSGIEIMANSNNVLRGGLTGKHVDVAELLKNVVFEPRPAEVLRPTEMSDGQLVYVTGAREFELSRLELRGGVEFQSDDAHSADILLVTEGDSLTMGDGGASLELRRGQSVLAPAGVRYRIGGVGVLYKASVPDPWPRFRGTRPTALRFGTSGLRGLVADMTDMEAYINTRGFLAYALETGNIIKGDPVSLAGDLRPSTDRISRAVGRAVDDAGLRVEYLGHIPTPALAASALERGRASIMVTGSHIPFDRNGIKFNKRTGEVLKSDEAQILEAVSRFRRREYGRPESTSLFRDNGSFVEGVRLHLPEELDVARKAYERRFVDFFPPGGLTGKRIVFFQHSAVGRDVIAEILRKLGAEVLPVGRSDEFIPIDTEDITDDRLRELQRFAEDAGGRVDAIVSTDGDSDRPLVAAPDENGQVRFFGGDLLGIVVADYLDAETAVVPVSVNDAVDSWLGQRGVELVKSKIGSPYVIEAMAGVRSGTVVGWEANGGFLTGTDIEKEGRLLTALPTRDATLPILCALYACVEEKVSLVELFSRLPRRFSKAGLIDEFPREASFAILDRFSKGDGVQELSQYFTSRLGFGAVERTDVTDGLRIFFDDGDIAHVRPSGNAPQLRIYAVADTQARADEIVAAALAEPDGILRRLERAVRE